MKFLGLLVAAVLSAVPAEASVERAIVTPAPSPVPAPGPGPRVRAGEPAIRFRLATEEVGLHAVHHDAPPLPGILESPPNRFGIGAAVSDYDRDGDPDVYVVDTHLYPNRLFRNDGGVFTDVTEGSGCDDLGYGHMALFLDLDGDGYDDLLVVNNSDGRNEYPGSQVYRNRGDGTFENRTIGSGIAPITFTVGGATASDYDKDGDLDLCVVNWIDGTWIAYQIYLYRNEGDFRFTDVTDAAGLRRPESAANCWSPVFVDLDNDGWQDLFTAVDFTEDFLFLNDGDGTFSSTARTVESPWHTGNDMGVAVGDIDNDGDLDLYTTNVTGGSFEEGPDCCNWLYVNDGTGRFVNEAFERGVNDTEWGWGTHLFDADLDGDLDLLAVNGWDADWPAPAAFFLNDGAGSFVEMAAECGIDHVGNSRALIPIDHDQDGDTDFIISDQLSPLAFYENVTERAGHRFLTVRLEGRESNRNGIGARVRVRAGGLDQVREIVAGGSFYAGPPLEATFGLGPAETADEVRVVWPSGAEQVVTEAAADQFMLFFEPGKSGRPSPNLAAAGPGAGDQGAGILRVRSEPAGDGSVKVRFDLPGAAPAVLSIYDVRGREVWSKRASASRGEESWNARMQGAAPGVYFARVRSAGVQLTRSFVIAR